MISCTFASRLTRRQSLGLAAALALRPTAAPAGRVPLAHEVLLARDWVPGDSPDGWLVSEKLDGVRATWDGRRLRFRSGRPVPAPPEFLAQLPAQPLDGELWLGRGRFDELSGIVRRLQPGPRDWDAVQYQVFELPGAEGEFAQRARRIQNLLSRLGVPALQAVAQQMVATPLQLRRMLDAVIARGGEGLMLHRADAPYVTGRSEVLRKFKPQSDAEAVVLEHRPGQGRLAGQLGALRVRTDDGRVFDVGSGLADALRAHPPAIGQRITYTHRGLTSQGLPRFASYLRAAPEF